MEALDIKTAIQIAKILAAAPEERLPMILGVFEKAEVDIAGLEELEEWKATKKAVAIMDIHKFRQELIEGATDKIATDGEIRIKNAAFNDFCKSKGISNRLARKALYDNGMIRTCTDKGKITYTVPMTDPETKQITRWVILTTE